MSRAVRLGSLIALLAFAVAGCGGGSTTTARETTTIASEAGRPLHRLVLAHRVGPRRREPGYQGLGASPCHHAGGGRVKSVDLFPESSVCVRVAPKDRLLLVNSTEIGGQSPTAVTVHIGNYVARVTPGRSALIPAPVGTYLGRGRHTTRATGAPAPSIMVLPEECAINRPKPGEELCFKKRPASRK